MAQAISLIGSLKDGDRVRVTLDGRMYDMTVVGRPTRSDGAFGELESVGVTVSLGPGRYSTRVAAENLVRTSRGRGFVGGGAELELINE
ncbi:hypothetical protein [Streptomyces fractus]|uniref:hypothetical protein n=1 Tax=Streptomyces fractus TaxID=641806 RepID=UPI003CEE7D63